MNPVTLTVTSTPVVVSLNMKCQSLYLSYKSYNNVFFFRCVAIKIAVFVTNKEQNFLCTFSSDSASQLDVFRHDGDTFSMDGTQVGVFKKTNKVSL